jgi:hypothetical protein
VLVTNLSGFGGRVPASPHGQVAWRAVDGVGLLRAAHQAEAALFRVVRNAPDDPGPPLCTRGDHEAPFVGACGAHGRLSTRASVEMARGALWAFERVELNDLDPLRIAQLAEEPPVETEFTSEEGVTEFLLGESRLAAAADARVALAERLARFQPRPPGDALTPEALDAYFRGSTTTARPASPLRWRAWPRTLTPKLPPSTTGDAARRCKTGRWPARHGARSSLNCRQSLVLSAPIWTTASVRRRALTSGTT